MTLRGSRQGVSTLAVFASSVDDMNFIYTLLMHSYLPSGMFARWIGCIQYSSDCCVVSVGLYVVSIQIVVKVWHCPDYCKGFQFSHLVVLFRREQWLARVGDWVQFTVWLNLCQDCTKTIDESISFQDEISIKRGVSKDWRCIQVLPKFF